MCQRIVSYICCFVVGQAYIRDLCNDFPPFLPQAFKVYMRRCGPRSPFWLDWFKPEDVVVDPSAPTWVDVMGETGSPPPWDKLPLPSDVLSGAARPDFNGLRLRNPKLSDAGICISLRICGIHI